MFSRESIQPSLLEGAPTIVQAAAVSQSRVPGEGTTPGWSQQSAPVARSRTVLVGFLAAFVVGLLLIGGVALVWLRWQKPSSVTAATAPSASAPPSPTEPLPPSIDPAPPVTGQGVAAAPPDSATPVRSRAPAGAGAGAGGKSGPAGRAGLAAPTPPTPAIRPTTPPPATSKPATPPPAASGNPLIL
jgi:hypothetical protein